MRPATALLALAITMAPLCAVESAHAQTEQAVALTRFNKGRDLFIAGNYASALIEFRAATELVESPNTRLYIARCEKELGHLSRAFVEYQRASTEAADRAASDPRYASTRDAAKQESATIEPMLGHVTVNGASLPKDVVITVAGSQMSAAALGVSAPVDPGSVIVTAKAKGYKSFQKNLEVTSGAELTVDLQLERDPDAVVATSSTDPTTDTSDATTDTGPTPSVHRVGGGVRVAGFVVGGLGVVGVVMFGTFAAMAQSKFSQVQNACGNRCDSSYNGQIDDGKRNQLIANVSLGLGIGLLIGGGIMIAAGGPKTVDGRGHAITFLPMVGPSPDGRGLGLGMSHAF
jgi:hypothetical protein